MAITTDSAHVARALDFFKKTNIYFAIGKSTPWNTEDIPPDPQVNALDLSELIGFKQVETIYMVKPDDSGTIEYCDSNWSVVPADQAISQGAKWVYIDTTLRYDELPLGYYRQVGLYTGVIPYQGRAEQTEVKITHAATANGNIAIDLAGIPLTVGVLQGDTIQNVVTKIVTQGSSFSGWTIEAPSTDTVRFTKSTVGVTPNATFDFGSTGVTGVVSYIKEGTDPVSIKPNLLPTEVDNHGILEVLDNREASNRISNQKEKLALVIEF